MPEGHVIHRVAEEQCSLLEGNRVIVESPQGRFQEEARQLSGRRLKSIEPHGKHLFYQFSGGKTVHVHLGLYGKYRQFDNPPPSPRGAVRMRVIGHHAGFDLNGPNRCQLITAADKLSLKARLGQDPLRSDADPQIAWQRVRRSRSPIGSLLLDQSIIAGIGNIYRTEILFLHRLNPQTPGNQISEQQFMKVWQSACELMALGKKLKKIVIHRKLGKSGKSHEKPRERFNIYKRSYCPDCDGPIYYWSLANRTVFACETCQPFSAGF